METLVKNLVEYLKQLPPETRWPVSFELYNFFHSKVSEEKPVEKPTATFPSEELREQIERFVPHLTLKKQTVPVAVVYADETEEELGFLKNLTKAIHDLLKPAVLVSVKELKTYEASFYIVSALAKQKCSTGLFLLPIADYHADPSLKKALWKTLCQRLKS